MPSISKSVIENETHLENAQTPAKFPDHPSFLPDLPEGGGPGLLIGLDAAAGHDPVVRSGGRSHQQHLQTRVEKIEIFCRIKTKATRSHLALLGIFHADASRPAPETILVVDARRVGLLFDHVGGRIDAARSELVGRRKSDERAVCRTGRSTRVSGGRLATATGRRVHSH